MEIRRERVGHARIPPPWCAERMTDDVRQAWLMIFLHWDCLRLTKWKLEGCSFTACPICQARSSKGPIGPEKELIKCLICGQGKCENVVNIIFSFFSVHSLVHSPFLIVSSLYYYIDSFEEDRVEWQQEPPKYNLTSSCSGVTMTGLLLILWRTTLEIEHSISGTTSPWPEHRSSCYYYL